MAKNKEIMELKEEPKTLRNKVFEALGEVSMCWSETPKGVFDSTNTEKIGNELMREIEKVINETPKTFIMDGSISIEDFVQKYVKNRPISVKEAIEVLCNALREDIENEFVDNSLKLYNNNFLRWEESLFALLLNKLLKEENSKLFENWQHYLTNDFYNSIKDITVNDFETGTDKKELLEACEKAAKNFLNLLINK